MAKTSRIRRALCYAYHHQDNLEIQRFGHQREKLYVYGRMLLRKLPVKRDQLPIEIQQNIDMDSYRVQPTSSGKIDLNRGTKELEPIKGGNWVQFNCW